MCSLKDAKKKRGFIDFGLFKNVFDQCYNLGIRKFAFHISGEPIIHPKIGDIVSYAKKKRIKICISTNGQLLNVKQAKKLMDAGVDSFRFSIEGSTKKDYEKIRFGGSFETLIKNMENLKKLRDSSYKDVEITVGSVILENTPDKITNFHKVFGPLTDEISFSELHTIGDQHKGANKNRRKRLCLMLFERIYITWEGLITICCFDFDNNLIVGNVKKDTIEKIWYNKIFNHYRKLHKLGLLNKMPMCGKCKLATPYEQYLVNKKASKLIQVN